MDKKVYLFSCPECGQMFKIMDYKREGNKLTLITDFNEHIVIEDLNFHCRKYNKVAKIKPTDFMTTSDWIADLVFTIKGER